MMRVFQGYVLFGCLVSFAFGCDQAGDDQSATSEKKEKIWMIAAGHDWGAHEYIDESGYLSGFMYDLIAAVCRAGRMKCRTVWDKYTNCWNSEAGQHAVGGLGLLGGRYDACSGWTGTIGRMQVFDFSKPFFPPSKSFFYKKKGSSFDHNNISEKKIGFQDGYMSDEKCLARQNIKGVPLPVKDILHYEDSSLMVNELINGKIDAIFVVDHHLTEDDRIEKVTAQSYVCAASGDAMMTRKDNDFNAYWNRGFQQLVASGEFKELCDESRQKYADVGEFQPCL